jgi:hypothetical protein
MHDGFCALGFLSRELGLPSSFQDPLIQVDRNEVRDIVSEDRSIVIEDALVEVK